MSTLRQVGPRLSAFTSFSYIGLVALLACGDSEGTGGSGGNPSSGGSPNTGGAVVDGGGGSGSGGAPSSGGSPSTGGNGGEAVGGNGGGCPEGGAPGTGGGAIEECSEIGAEDCFSNYDCPGEQRCQNEGTVDFAVPCCVPGARGDGPLGAACVGELDCASSLCIEGGRCGGICTDRCNSPDECPAELPQCITIAFSGTDDKFCAP